MAAILFGYIIYERNGTMSARLSAMTNNRVSRWIQASFSQHQFPHQQEEGAIESRNEEIELRPMEPRIVPKQGDDDQTIYVELMFDK